MRERDLAHLAVAKHVQWRAHMRFALAAILFAAAPAYAGDVIVATNFPLMYPVSSGLSTFIGVTDNHAIRVNAARYYHGLWMMGAEEGPVVGEHAIDASVGLMHYADGLWNGYNVEVDLLARRRDVRSESGLDTRYGIGPRLLAGWTWNGKGKLIVAAAVGLSATWEQGSIETTLESYLRFGYRI